MKHKIYLNAQKDLPAGYYGPDPQNATINEYIYWRVSEDKALEFSPRVAFDIVSDMIRRGYSAKCVPPVTITL